VQIALQTGAIVSCVDKASGLEWVGPGGWNVAQVLEDTSDTWSHRVTRFEDVAAGVIGHFGHARISVCDQGPLQASLLVERSYQGNTWLQQIALRHGEAEILIRNWLYWQGQWRMLKLAFDLAASHPRTAHDVPFGWCQRPCDGTERATQMWLDVSGEALSHPEQTLGLALIDDGKYGCDVTGSTARLTVLRSPPYAYHHPPHAFGAKGRYDWIDQGSQEFTLVLRPHVGDWREAGIVQRAREINLPIMPVTMHAHSGELATTASLAALSSPEMELTALKPADDGDGYIVRLADRHGRGAKGTFRWLDHSFAVTLAPFEVLTLRLTAQAGQWRSTGCDMIERPTDAAF